MGQNKISGYQKLKKENERLKGELSILALYPDSEKGLSIKMEWVMKANIEAAIWAGNPSLQSRQFINIETSKNVFSQ